MESNLREKFIRNLQASSVTSIMDFTDDNLSFVNEKILPGLGVMFELLWKNSSSKEKTKIIKIIKESIEN